MFEFLDKRVFLGHAAAGNLLESLEMWRSAIV